jgi:hypothetical protein
VRGNVGDQVQQMQAHIFRARFKNQPIRASFFLDHVRPQLIDTLDADGDVA